MTEGLSGVPWQNMEKMWKASKSFIAQSVISGSLMKFPGFPSDRSNNVNMLTFHNCVNIPNTKLEPEKIWENTAVLVIIKLASL